MCLTFLSTIRNEVKATRILAVKSNFKRYFLGLLSPPLPNLYGEELAKNGSTLWVNPPTRNPLKAKLILKNKNLLIFTPIIFKRSSDDSGFGKWEVRMQIKFIASFFLGTPSSVWSISTAYPHLIEENPTATAIF